MKTTMSESLAFISVADKSGLPEFSKNLANFYSLLAYGETATVLAVAGVATCNFRREFTITNNPSREELAQFMARQVRRRLEVARPIGLVCINLKPLSSNPSWADVDTGGPLIITAALQGGCPALTHPDQYPDATRRLQAGEFDEPGYLAELAQMAMETVEGYRSQVAKHFGA